MKNITILTMLFIAAVSAPARNREDLTMRPNAHVTHTERAELEKQLVKASDTYAACIRLQEIKDRRIAEIYEMGNPTSQEVLLKQLMVDQQYIQERKNDLHNRIQILSQQIESLPDPQSAQDKLRTAQTKHATALAEFNQLHAQLDKLWNDIDRIDNQKRSQRLELASLRLVYQGAIENLQHTENPDAYTQLDQAYQALQQAEQREAELNIEYARLMQLHQQTTSNLDQAREEVSAADAGLRKARSEHFRQVQSEVAKFASTPTPPTSTLTTPPTGTITFVSLPSGKASVMTLAEAYEIAQARAAGIVEARLAPEGAQASKGVTARAVFQDQPIIKRRFERPRPQTGTTQASGGCTMVEQADNQDTWGACSSACWGARSSACKNKLRLV